MYLYLLRKLCICNYIYYLKKKLIVVVSIIRKMCVIVIVSIIHFVSIVPSSVYSYLSYRYISILRVHVVYIRTYVSFLYL